MNTQHGCLCSLYLLSWYLKGLPKFNIVFINISFQLSCNFTPFLGIYQEILLFCMISIYFCKIHNGLDFFVGSPVVMRPDNDNYTFHNVKFIYDISSCPCYLDIFNYLSYILTYVIIFLQLHVRRMYSKLPWKCMDQILFISPSWPLLWSFSI